MNRLGLVALVSSSLVFACSRPPQAQTTTPQPAPATDEAASDDAPANPMTHTGVLSEEAFAKLHEHTDAAAPTPRGEMVDLAGGEAYLSLPEGAEAPVPGIVVIHEWWGLNDHIKHYADRLAAEGYAAIAVDLYAGEVATTPDDAMAMMKRVDEARAAEVLAAAHAFLGSDPRIQAPKRGVIGWCFGGGWSLQHAIATPDLDAAVVYYGRLVEDQAQLSKIQAPMLGIFGDQDAGIPPASVEAFAAAMEQAGKSLQVHSYEAPHAFANPSSGRYVPDAASAAWDEARAFLAEHLQ